DRAAARAEAALAHTPGLPQALDLLGRVAFRRAGATRTPEDLRAADAALARATEACGDDVQLLLLRALARYQQGDVEGKASLLGQVIALTEPTPNHRALVWRAHTHFVLDRPGEALADFERALTHHPEDLESQLWRALCLQRLGRFGEALREWQLLGLGAPDLVDAHLRGRGATIEVEPLRRGLIEALVAVARRSPPPAEALPAALSTALVELTRRAHAGAPWEELEPLLAAAADGAGASPLFREMVVLERARALFRRGRLDEARSQARGIVERARDARGVHEARFLEALTWLWGGDVRRGVDLLGRLHEADLGITGYSAGATWHSYLGRNGLGEVLARAALTLEPHATEPLIGLAFCLNDLGRSDEALAAIDEALRRAPDHPRAHMARFMIASALRRLDEADAALDAAIRLTEPAPFPRALGARAQLRLARGRADAALADLDRLLAQQPDDPEGLCARALVRVLLDQPGAADDLRRAFAADPGLSEAWLGRLTPALRQRLAALRR
ncbi:MAG: tetratricopeptide repeat protein, partial [Planctomycetes bacterium]|nr:tetratricopeptide repeat protein [Planctomycetota bacterium]